MAPLTTRRGGGRRRLTLGLALLLVGGGATPPAAAATSLDGLLRATRYKIMLDPGHGGTDPGALGPRGVREKDVVLQVALQARRALQEADCEVLLSRQADVAVSLPGRTAQANRAQVDALVSIHANAATHPAARGIETYYLNVAADRYALRLAARENQTSEVKVSELQLILADLTTKATTDASLQLARRTQAALLRHVAVGHPAPHDLGVKAALFYVLLGARMPAILVETSFITHPEEARLLQQSDYQRALGDGIAEAVVQYLDQRLLAAHH